MANQTPGGVCSNETPANAAMPAIEPAMSMAYALSGGMLRNSPPSGRASAAISATTRTTMSGRTRKFASAAWLSASPKKISLLDRTWMFSCAVVISRTVASRRNGNGEAGSRVCLRPRRMPRPIPRKLAISTKLLKKPT